MENSKSGTPSVVYGTDDIAKYQYNMIENLETLWKIKEIEVIDCFLLNEVA